MKMVLSAGPGWSGYAGSEGELDHAGRITVISWKKKIRGSLIQEIRGGNTRAGEAAFSVFHLEDGRVAIHGKGETIKSRRHGGGAKHGESVKRQIDREEGPAFANAVKR
jgi:hypothetical protein